MGMRRVSSRALEVVAGLGLLAFARVAAGNSINTDLSLTVAANGCSGFELNSLPQKFGYDLLVEAWSLGACEASSVSFSKFYIQDACIALRNNELGLSTITHSRCQEATDNTAAVCQQVFAANTTNNVQGATLGTLPQSIDSDNVCSSTSEGFVYIRNSCATPITATIKVGQSDYSGGPCIKLAGHYLNTWAIIIIVIVAVLALIIALWVLSCLCCQALTCCGCCCCR